MEVALNGKIVVVKRYEGDREASKKVSLLYVNS